jgi:acetate---CoA ligase (ADP-forming)
VNGEAVHALFTPKSIALVGATDKSGWSQAVFANLGAHGFTGPVHLVNPRTPTVHGQSTHPSLSAIGEPVDLAFVMVPTPAVLSVLRDGVRAGIRSYVILTAGFGETGDEGRLREEELHGYAAEHGLTVLGPNGNGFINAAAGITPYGLLVPHALKGGPVGVVLQSGALASSVLAFAHARGIGLSLLTSMGNEMMVSVTDVMHHLVDDPGTRVIALFLESVRRPEEFARAARRAARAGKPVVALKIGASALASHTAKSHTGALVGDDRVVDAAFRQLGVVRVRSLEDLIITAGLLAETGPVAGPRIGVVTPSGGACEIIADRAEQEGLELPAFAPETEAGLRDLVPAFASVANPLDVTGYVLVDRTLLPRALGVVDRDPGLDAVMLLSDLPRAEPADHASATAYYGGIARAARSAAKPVIVVSNVLTDITPPGLSMQAEVGFPQLVGGIEHAMSALSAAVRWSAARQRAVVPPPRTEPLPVPEGAATATGVWSERRAARLLGAHGVPVVPSRHAATPEEAAEAARAFGFPVVLKAAAEGLGHKSDIGGVRLGLRTPEEVRTAHLEITGALRAAGHESPGTLVQPQREGGVELLVGVVRDPAWGLTLAVGLGGVWVEALDDTALRLLPVTPGAVREALGELRGARLLSGARGTEPADLDLLAAAVTRICALAEALGPRLKSLEVNPLLVSGPRVEALDALVTWE